MVLQDLKREIESCSPEDRLYLLAYLNLLHQRDQPSHLRHLAARAREIEAGNAVSLDQLKRLHKALVVEGL